MAVRLDVDGRAAEAAGAAVSVVIAMMALRCAVVLIGPEPGGTFVRVWPVFESAANPVTFEGSTKSGKTLGSPAPAGRARASAIRTSASSSFRWAREKAFMRA